MKITEEEYNKNPKYCKQCGKKIEYFRMDAIFCNCSCAATYNNLRRGKRSEETKKKISEGLKHSIKQKHHIKQNALNRKRVCVICSKEFYDPPKHHNKTCSEECRHKLRQQIGRNNVKMQKERGTFKGWQSRKITSYAEKFFIQVLNNNHIPFEREYLVHTNNTKYFLDFKIEINNRKIDLEIDGKQHKYPERIEHDKIRDIDISNLGYEIYRIPWIQINSELGKIKMKNKINDFLDFYNK